MPETTPGAQVVLAEVGAERIGVDAEQVRAPFPMGRAARVPWAPAWVRGAIHHDGQIVTVVDLAHFAGLGESGPTPALIMPRGDEHQIALAVRAAATATGATVVRGPASPGPDWLGAEEEVVDGASFRRLALAVLIERIVEAL